VRTERRVADWQCNRCGNVEQTLIQVITAETSVIPLTESELAPLPHGWTHVEIHWNQGATLSQDLCTTCTEKIDGFMQRRYDVAEPAKDVVKEEPKPKAPRKRAAKKAVSKAT